MSIDYDSVFEDMNVKKVEKPIIVEDEEINVKPILNEINVGECIKVSKDPITITNSVFDLAIAKSKLDADNVQDLVKKSENFVVETDIEAKEGVALAMQARKMGNAIEKTRKEITRPHLDFNKAVKKYADGFSDCLKKMEKGILAKVESFQDAKELELKKIQEEQMKREEEARLKHEKEQREYEEAIRKRDREIAEQAVKEAKAKEDAEKGKHTMGSPTYNPPPTPLPVPPAPLVLQEAPIETAPQKISSDDGTSTTVKEWVYEITEKHLIPREYLIVDERAIKESISGGIRRISGVKIYEKTRKQYRVK